MDDGADLAAELRGGASGGIPWSVILDAQGNALITADGPEGNMGCPAVPHEIEHFCAMLDATRRHMSEEDRTIIERELRIYGASLTRPRAKSPGRNAYTEALRAVKYGRFADANEQLGQAFEGAVSIREALTDPAFRPLREDADNRALLSETMRTNAGENAIEMVDRNEPGRRIRLDGRVVDMESGEPLEGALIQVFHTDAAGEYRPGMDAGGGAGNPRLFGWLRTGSEGRFTVSTILPERYPNSSVPRHVHYRVWMDGYPMLESECFFDSDPNLTAATRAGAPRRNFPIVKLTLDEELRSVAELIVRVPK